MTKPTAMALDRAPTILVADFSTTNCQLLASAIARNNGFRVVDFASGSDEVIAAVCAHQPDMAVISARLRDGAAAGMDALRKLRTLQPECRIIMLLDDDHSELMVEAFRSGVKGVFCRSGTLTQLRKCIECVHQGQTWISTAELEEILGALMQSPASRFAQGERTKALSSREGQIAVLVSGGASNRDIAGELGLSEHTVKNYLSRMYEKLGISTRAELVLWVLSQPKPAEFEKNDRLRQRSRTMMSA